MLPEQVIDVSRQGVTTLLLMAGPIMLFALGVGLIISLFQALTQIQEMTLAFVPKILVVFVSIILLLPFMISRMTLLWTELADTMVSIGVPPV